LYPKYGGDIIFRNVWLNQYSTSLQLRSHCWENLKSTTEESIWTQADEKEHGDNGRIVRGFIIPSGLWMIWDGTMEQAYSE
jgi:hypothetical protein